MSTMVRFVLRLGVGKEDEEAIDKALGNEKKKEELDDEDIALWLV